LRVALIIRLWRERFKDALPGSCQGKRGYLILDLYQRLWPDTLLQVFSPDCRSVRASKRNGVGTAVHLGERAKKFYRVLDVEKIKGKLIAELQQEKEPPAPMSEVAKCLGYDQSFLYKHFPEICRAISSRCRAYRKRKREERKQKILDEVRQATFRVYDQNLYPSQERVRRLLTKPGSIKEPGALAAWHEALQDLGLENKEP